MPEFGVENLVDNDLISDLIYMITQIASDKEAYVGTMDYQKILYLLKKNLSEDNVVKKTLQFYWYLHGPYSTLIDHGLKKHVADGVLESYGESKGRGYVLSNGSRFSIEMELNQKRISEDVCEIIENYDFFKPRDEILKVIYEDAPFEFQRHYKLRFLPMIDEIKDESLLVVLGSGEETIMKELMKAEAKLPLNEEFKKFHKLFSRFVTLSDTLFEKLGQEYYPEGQEYFCDIAEEMWSVFCRKLRILEHDPYYDNKVDGWDRIYERSLKELSKKIESFEMFINDMIVDFPDIEKARVPEDSPWGVVVQGIIRD